MNTCRRGDVVLIEFPYADGDGTEIRPALVIQGDAYNAKRSKTVVAIITGNLKRRQDPSHVVIDPAIDPDCGLHGPSLVSCLNVFTLRQAFVLQTLGQLSPGLMTRVDSALAVGLDL